MGNTRGYSFFSHHIRYVWSMVSWGCNRIYNPLVPNRLVENTDAASIIPNEAIRDDLSSVWLFVGLL